MPVRIRLGVALAASSFSICRRQLPADGAQVLAQLLFVARADDHARDRRPLEQPVERDLRHRLAGLLGDRVEGVDDRDRGTRRRPAGPMSTTACSGAGSSAGSGCPRRILPVSRPQPSGLQTTAPTF